MSWMDSWSRPKKSAVTPPPLYLTAPNTPYCHACGRVISSRKTAATKQSATPAKYCSDRCRHHKPSKVDRRIEEILVGLLNGSDPSSLASDPANPSNPSLPQPPPPSTTNLKKKPKGDPRIIVQCTSVEELIFGSRFDPEKTHGRKRNKAKRTIDGDGDGDETDDYGYVNMDRQYSAAKTEGRSTDEDDVTSKTVNTSSDEEDHEHDNNPPEHSGHGDQYPSADETSIHSSTSSSNGGVPLHPSTSSSSTPFHPSTPPIPIVLSDHRNFGAGKVRPSQISSEVNFSVGGERGWAEKIPETPEMVEKRREGQRRAEEREMVRCAARRLCAFGYVVDGGGGGERNRSGGIVGGGDKKKKGQRGKVVREDEEGESGDGGGERRKKCEAFMNGQVVEASYAKGEWGIRWREVA